jgi:general stress protein YciG
MTKKQLSDAMREIGRKGGKARVKNQTKAQRSESARKAAEARWANKGAA